MNNICLGLIIVLILCVLWTIYWWIYLCVESFRSPIDGKDYRIISSFSDKSHVDAANRLAMINKFITDFKNYLIHKYIDKFDSTNHSESYRTKVHIVTNISKRYSQKVLKENNPMTTTNTSYVLNKGDEIAFCLREKDSGFHNFHDINTLQFVVLHELTHLGLDAYGHEIEFWKAFHFLTHEAYKAGLYTPIDYSKKGYELTYCGVDVSFNPFFHDNLSLP